MHTQPTFSHLPVPTERSDVRGSAPLLFIGILLIFAGLKMGLEPGPQLTWMPPSGHEYDMPSTYYPETNFWDTIDEENYR